MHGLRLHGERKVFMGPGEEWCGWMGVCVCMCVFLGYVPYILYCGDQLSPQCNHNLSF